MESFVNRYKLVVTIEDNDTLDIKIFHILSNSCILVFAKKRFLGPDGVVLDYISTVVNTQYDLDYVNTLSDDTPEFNNLEEAKTTAETIIKKRSVTASQGGSQSPFHGEWRF